MYVAFLSSPLPSSPVEQRATPTIEINNPIQFLSSKAVPFVRYSHKEKEQESCASGVRYGVRNAISHQMVIESKDPGHGEKAEEAATKYLGEGEGRGYVPCRPRETRQDNLTRSRQSRRASERSSEGPDSGRGSRRLVAFPESIRIKQPPLNPTADGMVPAVKINKYNIPSKPRDGVRHGTHL